MSLILDAGALIALERNNRFVWDLLAGTWRMGSDPITHGGVIGQVWRGSSRQARLAMGLKGVAVRPLDDSLGRRAGELLREARYDDVVDAALVLLASDGDVILTSDNDDISLLAEAADLYVDVVTV